MMNQNRPVLYIPQPCHEAVLYIIDRMRKSGLQVLRTFDLHDTCMSGTACTCPNHGTEKCDCQMVVLLVYGKDNQPASLVAHGYNGQTWFSLVEFLGTTDSCLEGQIIEIIKPTAADESAPAESLPATDSAAGDLLSFYEGRDQWPNSK